jgi:hypothetical protein
MMRTCQSIVSPEPTQGGTVHRYCSPRADEANIVEMRAAHPRPDTAGVVKIRQTDIQYHHVYGMWAASWKLTREYSLKWILSIPCRTTNNGIPRSSHYADGRVGTAPYSTYCTTSQSSNILGPSTPITRVSEQVRTEEVLPLSVQCTPLDLRRLVVRNERRQPRPETNVSRRIADRNILQSLRKVKSGKTSSSEMSSPDR